MKNKELKGFVDYLKSKNIIKSGTQLSKTLDYSRQYMSDMVNGKREITKDFENKLLANYKFHFNNYQNVAVNKYQEIELAMVVEDESQHYRNCPSCKEIRAKYAAGQKRIAELEEMLSLYRKLYPNTEGDKKSKTSKVKAN
jgi:plasmid maintenance system antidote protein VapI